ncbi:unnamed protein product [Auanema sp. JU1783]|nr:unnamed protein product [Auanema sp. JU1783]
MSQLFAGKPLLKKVGEEAQEIDGGDALKDKVIGLYFSAMWCPSCRQFTPKLAKFYKEVKAAGKNLEIVLVSRDREDADLKEYFVDHNGDWLAIPFGDERIPEYLKQFEVPTIPAFKIIKSDGTIAVDKARFDVQERGKDEALTVFEEWEKASQ